MILLALNNSIQISSIYKLAIRQANPLFINKLVLSYGIVSSENFTYYSSMCDWFIIYYKLKH